MDWLLIDLLSIGANQPTRGIPVPLHANGGHRPRTRGQRDRSLSSRHNRRKAAR
jgi:hypothetical protein